VARKSKKKQKLPFGVGCLAFFLFIGSLILVAFGVILAAHYLGHEILTVPKSYWRELNKVDNIVWMVAILEGCIGLPTAIGLFAKKRWAYNVYTIINGFAIGLDGFELIAKRNLLVAPHFAFVLIICIYMLLPNVRKVFA